MTENRVNCDICGQTVLEQNARVPLPARSTDIGRNTDAFLCGTCKLALSSVDLRSHADHDEWRYEVDEELEKLDSSLWKITNRMVDVDTGETLYRLRESDVGPGNFTEILTESQVEQAFQMDGDRDDA